MRRHVWPVAHELGDQPWNLLLHRAVERGFIIEQVNRLMNGGMGQTPEPPRLFNAEGFYGLGQEFVLVPLIEPGTLGGIGDGGPDNKNGSGQPGLGVWRTP
jgi:hypothetical protein